MNKKITKIGIVAGGLPSLAAQTIAAATKEEDRIAIIRTKEDLELLEGLSPEERELFNEKLGSLMEDQEREERYSSLCDTSLPGVAYQLTREVGLYIDDKPLPRKDRHGKMGEVKAASLIGRNDPCPCGSGIKKKKCCN